MLTCGVGRPDLTDPPSAPRSTAIGWLVPAATSSTATGTPTFTADGYRPRVQLVRAGATTCPRVRATALAELARPLKQHLTKVERCV